MIRVVFRVALAAALLVPLPVLAQSAPPAAMPPAGPQAAGAPPAGMPPGGMPPGMTPELMKMMNTPGPKHPAGVPAGNEPWGGCIPTMGFHYVKAANAPFGPIYGWYKGKLTFTEIMISKKDFDAGKSWDQQLIPLPGYKIDHVDIWFEKNGHPGYGIPHYDIHAWYVPHAEHMAYCGNTSGKRPPFM